MRRVYPFDLSHIPAFAAAFSLTALPVLVFNGYGWYPQTDFFKWTLVFSVTAYGAGFCAIFALIGRSVRLGAIGAMWLALALSLALQPALLQVRCFPEWVRNWYFFAALGGAVFFLSNLPLEEVMPGVLRSAAATGGVSTVIGFVRRAFPTARIPFVSEIGLAPDRFFANARLDNLLGAYLALAITAGFWLIVRALLAHRPGEAGGKNKEKSLFARPAFAFDLALAVLNSVGLWMTGARSAVLSCAAGVIVLLTALRPDARLIRKIALCAALALAALFCAALLAPGAFRVERRDMSKILSPESLSPKNEGRIAIWGITLEMIGKAPVLGVGLGNYKWNYMDATADFMEKSDIPPRYTYWAHNEYLQWLAETGAVGAALFSLIIIYAVALCVKSLKTLRKKNQDRGLCPRPPGSLLPGPCSFDAGGLSDGERRLMLSWALAAIAVLAVDSCFSRPFHHADTAFSFSLALAVISRLCPEPLTGVRSAAAFPALARRALGPAFAVILLAAVSGVALFAQSFSGQRYLGEYYYNTSYISLVPSEEREAYYRPFLFSDAYLRLIARENFIRAEIGFDDREKDDEDAIRLLTECFARTPGYEELNMLMRTLQRLGRIDEARLYFRYYPPEEREKFLRGEFDGRYMLD
ncbi:MAG: O-antigen ligase family protein [Synergistaceae bacterium]|jgi:hypothetical protein|nr:O-antigen ligase family protein [Synergistaceae bacterium]